MTFPAMKPALDQHGFVRTGIHGAPSTILHEPNFLHHGCELRISYTEDVFISVNTLTTSEITGMY